MDGDQRESWVYRRRLCCEDLEFRIMGEQKPTSGVLIVINDADVTCLHSVLRGRMLKLHRKVIRVDLL